MKRVLLIGAMVAALAAGLVAVTATGAQEGVREQFLARVAEKLGISESELTQAMTDVRIEMIDEAVADGRITQERADELKARIEENGPLFFGPHGGGPHGGPCGAARFGVRAAAEVLDVEVQEVVEALQSGQSLAEFAEAQGMSAEDFKAAMLDQVRTRLDALVEDGKLTQDQADARFERFSENVDTIINAHPDTSDVAPCRGRGHFRHGPGGPPGPWSNGSLPEGEDA